MTTNQFQIEDITNVSKRFHRVVMTDPMVFYQRLYDWSETLKINSRLRFDHSKRQNYVGVLIVFPNQENNTCACGCGQALKGRRTRYATDECSSFVRQTIAILSGKSVFIRQVVAQAHGDHCCQCGITDNEYPRKQFNPEKEPDFHKREKLWSLEIRELANKIHLDHIIPVHQGGGGCWLNNYQMLCEKCHKEKTKNERK